MAHRYMARMVYLCGLDDSQWGHRRRRSKLFIPKPTHMELESRRCVNPMMYFELRAASGLVETHFNR